MGPVPGGEQQGWHMVWVKCWGLVWELQPTPLQQCMLRWRLLDAHQRNLP